jgi:type I restriction enzyme S subunit
MKGWELYKLEEICKKIVSGGTPLTSKREYYENGNIPWLKTTEIHKEIIRETETYITAEGLKNSSAKLIPASSIIVAMYGDGGTAGNVALTRIPLTTNQACCNLIIDETKADPGFIYYYLKANYNNLVNLKSGGSQQNLNALTIRKFPVLLPDLPIQQNISTILFAYESLIEINNQRIKLLEETARELYKEWFVRMRFPGYKKYRFEKGIPVGWEINTCYYFSDVKGGGTPSTTNPIYWNGQINFFTPTDHSNSFYIIETEKKITERGLKESSTKLFPKYSTFITARGTVGNICLAGEQMAMNQSCFGIVPHNEEDCFFTFLFTDLMVSYLKQVASGATFDAITLNTFKKYKSIIPEEVIRNKFNQIVSPIFFQIENLIHQNTQLRQIRDRLLPRLISGKLKVKAKREELVCP